MDSSTKMRAIFFILIYIKYAFYTHEEIDRKFRGGGIIILCTYATFENTTSDAGTTNVDNKRRI